MQGCIKPLDHLIIDTFIPTQLQVIITDQDRVLYSLPVKQEVLGISIYPKYQKHTTNIRNQISASPASVIIMQGSKIPGSKIRNEIKYSKNKESDVLLKDT